MIIDPVQYTNVAFDLLDEDQRDSRTYRSPARVASDAVQIQYTDFNGMIYILTQKLVEFTQKCQEKFGPGVKGLTITAKFDNPEGYQICVGMNAGFDVQHYSSGYSANTNVLMEMIEQQIVKQVDGVTAL